MSYHNYNDEVSIEDLRGHTFKSVRRSRDNEILIFEGAEGNQSFEMLHNQSCCESVSIEDICGDLSDLEDVPILHAHENTNSGSKEYGDSYTWTFYNISTIKGSVTIRWYGTSNGYYSESVNIYKITPAQDE